MEVVYLSRMAVVGGCYTSLLLSTKRPPSTPTHTYSHSHSHRGKLVVTNFSKLHQPLLPITPTSTSSSKAEDTCASTTLPFASGMMDFATSLPLGPIIANAFLLAATPLQALADTTCEADQSLFNMNMPLLLLVALIGATVGGLLARQRKGELQRLNEQLRQINAALKRQAKIESYAPALSYAPAARVPDNEVIVDPKKQELISRLKNGKNFLRNQNPDKAFSEFKAALELAQNIKDPIEEKKAARGLGASMQRQGKYKEAIKYHSMVLSISEREGEDSGNTEAFGAIADCYTELGDLEKAASFYDQYISRLQAD
ncbi:hypothetical protein M8C21_013173 [Ambrosia artemisiifolia]|uniref:Protein FLUORESCENT IN BLUE LIGHT, chloroplastic n=1 Tax=Ambrosia artemisiifolia TaxID=4212 RepID=A0AAD5G4N4_AMBAR|nr:hypothetical protein M8C21_013173 [Ambrosia artemisiifolia]